VSLGKSLILNNNWLTKYDSVRLTGQASVDDAFPLRSGTLVSGAGSDMQARQSSLSGLKLNPLAFDINSLANSSNQTSIELHLGTFNIGAPTGDVERSGTS
jgi:hypothetical protein